MAVEILTHSHAVIDDDRHFLIDPDTKQITPAQSDVKIAQHSKNSERLTFEIPSVTVEGHDMTKCNQVAIHFRNVDARTGQESIGIYMVPADDIVTDGANEVTVSWLVDDDATVYAGGLVFSIHFICTENGAVVYDFPTLTYTGLTVGETVWNSEVIARKYPDIIANHEARITALEENGAPGEAPTVTNVTVTEHGDGRFTQVKEFSDGSEEVTEVTVDENGIPIRVTVNGVEIPYFFRYGGDDPVIPEEPEIPDDPVIPDEPGGKIVGYSYNGVRLAKLPESPYPHAIIFPGGPFWYVVFSDAPLQLNTMNFNNWSGDLENSAANWERYRTTTSIDRWDFYDKSESAGASLFANSLKWANYDVYRTDDTLALEKSEPIPVYE